MKIAKPIPAGLMRAAMASAGLGLLLGLSGDRRARFQEGARRSI